MINVTWYWTRSKVAPVAVYAGYFLEPSDGAYGMRQKSISLPKKMINVNYADAILLLVEYVKEDQCQKS
jgi:hypothetical protein